MNEEKNITEEQTVEQLIASITHPKKRAFLENYYKFINTKQTTMAIGVCETTPYDWFKTDKVFNEAYLRVKKRIDTDRLEEVEAEIHKRALEGLSKQSDILLIFEAKSLDPNKYREKPVMIPISGDIIVRHMIPRPPGVEVKQIKEGGRDGYREEESVTEGEDKALQG